MSETLTFDAWCFKAIDERVKIDGRPVPLLTTLIYKVCEGDGDKFDEVVSMLERAFKAGQTGKAN